MNNFEDTRGRSRKSPEERQRDALNIPEDLRKHACWAYCSSKKVPIQVASVLTGAWKGAKSNDLGTLIDFEELMKHLFSAPAAILCPAFALKRDMRIACIDLDDPEPKIVELNARLTAAGRGLSQESINEQVAYAFELQRYILDTFRAAGAYIERSVSGKGWHVFFIATTKHERYALSYHGNVYTSGQFIYTTGDLADNPAVSTLPDLTTTWESVEAHLLGLNQLRVISAAEDPSAEEFGSSKVSGAIYDKPHTFGGRPVGFDDATILWQLENGSSQFWIVYQGGVLSGDFSKDTRDLIGTLDKLTGDGGQVRRLMERSPRMKTAGTDAQGTPRWDKVFGRNTDHFAVELQRIRRSNDEWFSRGNKLPYMGIAPAMVEHGRAMAGGAGGEAVGEVNTGSGAGADGSGGMGMAPNGSASSGDDDYNADTDWRVLAAQADANAVPPAPPAGAVPPQLPQADAPPSVPAEPQDMGDPYDLWGAFEPPAFPSDVLAPVIEEFARQDGELMGADPSGLAMAALTTAMATIPDHMRIKVKRHDAGWFESPRIWAALVGDPSTKKSPIISKALSPIRAIEAANAKRFVTELEQYELLNEEEKQQVQKPVRKRLLVSDTTIEATQEVLAENELGILADRDELSGWFGALDRYTGASGSGSADRAFWLQAFNGGYYSVDRIKRGAKGIQNLSISLIGGIQPSAAKGNMKGTLDDGLIQRINPVVLREATSDVDRPSGDGFTRYRSLIQRLYELHVPGRGGDFRFDDEAQELRQRLAQRHVELGAIQLVSRRLASHIGKYDGMFARLALSLHIIEWASGTRRGTDWWTVHRDTAQRAADFLHKFLLPHALSFYLGVTDMSDDQDDMRAIALLILARRAETITPRDIQRSSSKLQLTTDKIGEIMTQLQALNWVEEVGAPVRNRPSHWKINPRAHVMYEQRGNQERQRREEARRSIEEMARMRKGR